MLTTYRELQVLLALRDLLEFQALKDSKVMKEKQVKMVKKESRDLQVILESVSMHQDLLEILEKKEIKDDKEGLVFPVEKALLDLKDLKEGAANMHHLAKKVYVANQVHLVKMVNQESQEILGIRDRKAKPLDWKSLKIKLLITSNFFVYN